ncbi:ferredoxin [Sphingomonas vulcanisoli]|uniref:Ferredoxin n=1 Tax=Sphingomonas vulcanisoli TaxID=1658060 RepID=A0ABX0TW32_9SPHN|nr:2Fe-2S iron-sulfur cluster-binding protein [Sphingomonas vulcanisoli]NIJ08374.1 ferredoxin [Sphingomonas vulcanisoli]
MTIRVRFVSADGGEVREANAEEGARLLEVAQAAAQPLEGTCEGQMACSTCHIIVDPEWFAKLPRASEEEDDLLDLATGVSRTSRLACQIHLTTALDGLTVRMPGESRDMRGR